MPFIVKKNFLLYEMRMIQNKKPQTGHNNYDFGESIYSYYNNHYKIKLCNLCEITPFISKFFL